MVSRNLSVPYFVGEKFVERFPSRDELLVVEQKIESDYFELLKNTCYEASFRKRELERKLYYYRNSGYKDIIENELKQVDTKSCDQYQDFKERIRGRG